MCRLVLTTGLCWIIASLASLTNTAAIAAPESGGSTEGFCKGKKDGNYVNPSNLNTFYSCSNGLTYIMNCQKGLIFRKSCNCCDWPTTTTPTTTTTTRSSESTEGFCSGQSDGIYANPNNPNSFYHCSNGLTHIQNCPADLIFRESCKCCDWPTKPGGSTGGFCSGKQDGIYANPDNSHTFYHCSNGLTYIQKCPAGLIFRQLCKCCDWPVSPAEGFCSGKRNGNYANPHNPNSFYSCSNGLTYIMNCPADLIFWQSCNCCVYN